MVKFNSEQLDDLLSHLKDLWDEAKDKLGDYSEEFNTSFGIPASLAT